MEWSSRASRLPAERAYHFGLVNRLVEEGEALDAAPRLAEQICDNAPLAVRESRKSCIEATDGADEVGCEDVRCDDEHGGAARRTSPRV